MKDKGKRSAEPRSEEVQTLKPNRHQQQKRQQQQQQQQRKKRKQQQQQQQRKKRKKQQQQLPLHHSEKSTDKLQVQTAARQIEKSKFQEMFELTDLNKDGFIDDRDLRRLFKQLNIYVSRKEIARIIERHDVSKTGQIDFDRFCKIMSNERRVSPESEVRAIFHAIDRSGRGNVNRVELRASLSRVDAEITGKDLDDMFNALGVDTDGVVTLNEFKAVLQHLD